MGLFAFRRARRVRQEKAKALAVQQAEKAAAEASREEMESNKPKGRKIKNGSDDSSKA